MATHETGKNVTNAQWTSTSDCVIINMIQTYSLVYTELASFAIVTLPLRRARAPFWCYTCAIVLTWMKALRCSDKTKSRHTI